MQVVELSHRSASRSYGINASAVLSGWISQFSPARFAAPAPLDIQRNGATLMESVGGDARPFKRGGITQRYLHGLTADGKHALKD